MDVLVRAVRSLPADRRVQLTIRAPRGGAEEQAYEARVRHQAAGDARISIEGPVARELLPSLMSAYDAIAVPSTVLETGPLVVLEALAAGLFILGSRLGGIAEIMDEYGDGALVKAGDVAAWAKAIEEMIGRKLQGQLPRRMRPVRSMATVASEMAELYRSL